MDARAVPPQRQAGAYLGEGQLPTHLHAPLVDPTSHSQVHGVAVGAGPTHHPNHQQQLRAANQPEPIAYAPVYASQLSQIPHGGYQNLLLAAPHVPLQPGIAHQSVALPQLSAQQQQISYGHGIYGQNGLIANPQRIMAHMPYGRQEEHNYETWEGGHQTAPKMSVAPPPPAPQGLAEHNPRPRSLTHFGADEDGALSRNASETHHSARPDRQSSADATMERQSRDAARYQDEVDSGRAVLLPVESLRKSRVHGNETSRGVRHTQSRVRRVGFNDDNFPRTARPHAAGTWRESIPPAPWPRATDLASGSLDSYSSSEDEYYNERPGRHSTYGEQIVMHRAKNNRRERRPSLRRPDGAYKIKRGGVTLKRVIQQGYRDLAGKLKIVEYPDNLSVDGSGIGPVNRPNDGEREESSITLVRAYDEDSNMRHRVLRFKSSGFINLLRDIGKYHLYYEVFDGAVTFAEPFSDLFYRREGLQQFLDDEKKKERKGERSARGKEEEDDAGAPERSPVLMDKIFCAELILEILENDLVTFSETFNNSNSLTPDDLISFEDLWTIYKPHTLVYVQFERQSRYVVMLESVECHQSPFTVHIENNKYATPITLHTWYIDHYRGNGWQYTGKFGRKDYNAVIPPFEGRRPISSLNFIPEAFFKNEEAKSKLMASGRNFWQLYSIAFREIPRLDGSGRPTLESERIMIDPTSNDVTQLINQEASYENSHPSSWVHEFNEIDPTTEPTELMLLLCPPSVRGFSLREKTWSIYLVANLRPVQFQQNAWSRLVIDREYKDVVQAMVNSHLRPSNRYEDLIPGKGGGVVILLHGPPGVGKTLTAESVAENVKKPLYMVTAGDLGTDPEHLEAKLAKIFQLAAKWDAILLLDEADIFLQDRDYENLTRNALVSIFLRTLEYFKGIMFLTSNRVGAFDQAFQSRIHITLGIPEFNEDVRKQVWKIFLSDLGRRCRDGQEPMLTREECMALGREVLESWAKEPLNGRQIRNCVRSALALAQDKGEKVSAEHFNTVIRLGNTFTRYMHSLQKLESDEVAQVKGDRLADMRSLMNGLDKIDSESQHG